MPYVIKLETDTAEGYCLKFRRSWNARVPYTNVKNAGMQFDTQKEAQKWLDNCKENVWSFGNTNMKAYIVETDSKTLLTKQLKRVIPDLGTTDNQVDRIVYTRFYVPNNNWEWYPFELSNQSDMMYGLVIGFEKEIGYFSEQELLSSKSVYRDTSFEPIKWSELKIKLGYLY